MVRRSGRLHAVGTPEIDRAETPVPDEYLVPSTTRIPFNRRTLAAAGAAGPLIFLAVSALAGFLKPGYDLVGQSVSELALGAHGWLQTVNFFVLGAALVAAAI